MFSEYDPDSYKTIKTGNVTFANISGASPIVEYIAPNIFLEPGFIAGPNFSATLGDCVLYQFRYADTSREKYFNQEHYNTQNNQSSNLALVYPNPIRKGDNLSHPSKTF